ncbi:MAG: DUF362 domain-containing protein [Clostridia bacterium]|nr:DUF362 domain-containing protein [Clostridia bacterium]
MEKVSLIACDDYEQSKVDSAVSKAIELIGGIEQFVKPGQTVVLKANMLMKCNIEKAATTHPSVVEAVGKLVKNAGAGRVIIADSAGGPFTEGYMNGIYKTCGLKDVAERCGFEMNSNFDTYSVDLPEGKVGKHFLICDCLEQADVIINLCKLKTHSFTGYTNAVKNMFGAIPGLTKVEMHGQFKTLDVFGDFMYDVLTYFKDKLVLHVTDAVVAMEGAGPSNGDPRKVGAIVAGANPVAVDVVALKLINAEPITMPFIETGVSRGFIDENLSIDVLGDKIEDLVVADFKKIQPDNFKPFANYVPRFLQNTVHRLMTQRPTVRKSKCKGCKKCFEHCPVKAITMKPTKKNGTPKAHFDYNKCIRCYCCQELCPFGLVKVKSGIVYKIVHIGSRKKVKNKTK